MKSADLDAFGLARGCPRYDHQRDYGRGRTSKPHSKRCMETIMNEVAKTEAGNIRIAAAMERIEG